MKSWVPEFVVLLALFIPLLSGCSGWLEEPAPPTPVAFPRSEERAHPFVPGVHRYMEEGDRLVFTTPAPTPALSPAPSPSSVPSLVPSQDGLVASLASTPTPEPPGMLWQGDVPSCVDLYRRMLVGYDGRIPFGAEVAWSLSEEFRNMDAGCADEGWDPLFDAGVVCERGSIAGVRISPGLTRRLNSIAHPKALPTGRDSKGNILVHFRRLPLGDGAGCWYYNSARRVWAWTVLGVESGVDRPRFPDCDALLLSLIAASADEGFGPLHVARALDEAGLRSPGRCVPPLWSPFPFSGSHEDCGVSGGTLLQDDGLLVVSWHPDYRPADGSVCWVLDSGSWEFFYPDEDG